MRRNLTTSQAPREIEVYATPDRRIVVIRYGRDDFGLLVDGAYNSSHRTQIAAEVAGGLFLFEEMEATAIESADIAAYAAEVR